MVIIIGIPHQSNCLTHYFSDRQSVIDDVNINSTVEVPTFDRAIEEFSHDWHSLLIIEDKEDLEKALNYPTSKHKWSEVRREAFKIKKEYFY